MISGSALDRIHACPVSETYPHVDEVNEDQARGNAVHDFLYNVTRIGRDEALDEVPDEWRETCEAIDLGRLPACDPASWAGEVAMVYDTLTDTAREIGRGIGRDYGETLPTEIPGSVDVIGLAEDCAVVVDYKGRWSSAPPARVNRQLRFYALCACRIWNKPAARVGVCRVGDDGSAVWDWATFDGFELDEIANEVCATLDAVHKAAKAARGPHEGRTDAIRPVIGPHCRYCPALAHCPAQNRLALALGAENAVEIVSGPSGDADVASFVVSSLTPENAAQAWHRLKAAKRIVEQVDAALRAYAGFQPLDLGNGKTLAARPGKRDSVDGEVAYRVLRDRFGEEVAASAVGFDSSKAAIDRALKPVAKQFGKPRAPIVREVLQEIEAQGGVSTTRSLTVKEGKG